MVEGHQCERVKVDIGVPQGSPILPLLFAIYLSGNFKEMEKEVDGYMATSFADYYGWLVAADSVLWLCKHVEREGTKAVEC